MVVKWLAAYQGIKHWKFTELLTEKSSPICQIWKGLTEKQDPIWQIWKGLFYSFMFFIFYEKLNWFFICSRQSAHLDPRDEYSGCSLPPSHCHQLFHQLHYLLFQSDVKNYPCFLKLSFISHDRKFRCLLLQQVLSIPAVKQIHIWTKLYDRIHHNTEM